MPVPPAPQSPGYPQLPAGFRFGTSTAAYQIEGAATEDGRGPSIWDTFCAQEGRIADGSSGAVACDHYHRYAEDVALKRRLGAGGYRLSLSWPRIQPTGSGASDARGLDFYDRLLDCLLESGIQPMVTLYHWDLPQALEDDGGWLNRATIDRFADFAAIALRAAGATSIGCANNHAPMWPATDDEADVGATKLFDAIWNGMYVEPMLLGRYPADLAPLMEEGILEGDMATIRQPLDFYGVNYYNPMKVAAAGEDAEMPFEFRELVGYPTTDFGWPVVPDALREWLITLRARYRAALPPIMITESGCSYGMGPDEQGVVDDQPRIDYLEAHLEAVATAIRRGVDVRGYYTWSLLDNFEWAEGYSQRFGLVHVDYETQKRTPKRSFQWYADMIAAQPKHAG